MAPVLVDFPTKEAKVKELGREVGEEVDACVKE